MGFGQPAAKADISKAWACHAGTASAHRARACWTAATRLGVENSHRPVDLCNFHSLRDILARNPCDRQGYKANFLR